MVRRIIRTVETLDQGSLKARRHHPTREVFSALAAERLHEFRNAPRGIAVVVSELPV
jgi:hypothetical protein